MWFLIPLALGGGLILHNLKKKKIASDKEDTVAIEKEDIRIEYRRIYICHSFDDSSLYEKLARKLKFTEEYKIFNHSIPKNKRRNTQSDEELRVIFRQQMSGCTHVFVLASPDIPKKSYVKMELEVAQELGKEIVAVTGRNQFKIPPFIRKMSNVLVTNDTRNLKKQLKK
ncbi:TIR domain-containing protein [Flectobacillus rivi]|uniref:TIR domain-containing protein n=1 Tax=Flectobacillus rivi TaxID=2984209 RepID=A0ABT6Z7M7_9BACT|nr:TIR domain-containing protein [Flectobacillus rivi]MDI9876596.1 TIR domain-containing protein [Flectobacillus rivi]